MGCDGFRRRSESEIRSVSDLISWALERWPFGVSVVLAIGFLYAGMLFGWGPDIIRPVSAQTVQQQITVAKGDMLKQLGGVQSQLSTISSTQDAIQKSQRADRLERIEQQLLWYRQQNCKSKGAARNYTWQKMSELKDRYRELTSSDWQMPTCSDIGS